MEAAMDANQADLRLVSGGEQTSDAGPVDAHSEGGHGDLVADVILEAGAAIRHTHFAGIEGRRFPAETTPTCARFFQRLRDVQYSGRCSIEAFTDDFPADARRALGLLRSIDQE